MKAKTQTEDKVKLVAEDKVKLVTEDKVKAKAEAEEKAKTQAEDEDKVVAEDQAKVVAEANKTKAEASEGYQGETNNELVPFPTRGAREHSSCQLVPRHLGLLK